MNGHQIDELLKRKVDNARRGRTLRTAAALLVLLALIVLIGTAVHLHKAKAVNAPDVPSTADTEPDKSDEAEAPDTPDTPEVSAQTKDGKKPLQPEEIRRLQTKHELVLEWVGVPEEERPPMVTVTMLHQSEEAARFTLTEENEWRHSWSDYFSADSLTLRAELPKSVMASFALRGNQFTLYASGSSPAASAPAGGGETAEDGEGTEEDGEASAEEDGQAEEDQTSEDAEKTPESGEEEDAEAAALSGSIDAPADEEEADEADEISEAPVTRRNWWPIVLLMVCGAVLVTLGVFGSDRRRTR